MVDFIELFNESKKNVLDKEGLGPPPPLTDEQSFEKA